MIKSQVYCFLRRSVYTLHSEHTRLVRCVYCSVSIEETEQIMRLLSTVA